MTRSSVVLLVAAFLLLSAGVGTAAADSSAPNPAALVASAQALAGTNPVAGPGAGAQQTTPASAPTSGATPAAAPAAGSAPSAAPAPPPAGNTAQ